MTSQSRGPLDVRLLDDTIVVIGDDGTDDPQPELAQRVLLDSLGLFEADRELPAAIVLEARGVLLATEGSRAIERFAALERRGVLLVVCKACADYLGVAHRVRAGALGEADDVAAAKEAAEHVITL